MKKKNLVVFEIEDVYRTTVDKAFGNGNIERLVFVKLKLPYAPDKRIYDLFWLIRPYIEKLRSFFKSIGEMKPGERHKMNWNSLVGKRGICELTKDGLTVKRYVYFPGITDLIQKEN